MARDADRWPAMRALAQPPVVSAASLAAALTALVCYPRLALWTDRPAAVWFLELAVLCPGFVLWSFVFGWQGQDGRRDPRSLSRSPALWALGTAAALLAAVVNAAWLDPRVQAVTPGEFPTDLTSWLAMTLFSLSLGQLFCVFAPLAFFLRMGARMWLAVTLTIGFAVFILALKVHSLHQPLPLELLASMIVGRVLGTGLLLYFYLKGGLPLAWWMSLLVQARHLLNLPL